MTWRKQVDALCEQGNELQQEGDFAAAYDQFAAALALVPADEQLGPTGAWIYIALADVLFCAHKYAEARRYIDLGILAGGFATPYAHLLRGQILLELGDDGCSDELLRALLLGGEKLFQFGAAKYWDHVTARARPPEGMASWRGWTGAVEGSELHRWLTDPRQYAVPVVGR
jgi:hypothetical protein